MATATLSGSRKQFAAMLELEAMGPHGSCEYMQSPGLYFLMSMSRLRPAGSFLHKAQAGTGTALSSIICNIADDSHNETYSWINPDGLLCDQHLGANFEYFHLTTFWPGPWNPGSYGNVTVAEVEWRFLTPWTGHRCFYLRPEPQMVLEA